MEVAVTSIAPRRTDFPKRSPASDRCPEDDLPDLLAAARAAKERFKPGVITYSRKVFLPLTNLCRDYCGYCTFRRDPGDPARTP